MTWLWTDALAALLVEHDRVAATCVSDWVDRPVAYRLLDDRRPLELARALLAGKTGAVVPGAAERAAG